MSLSILGMGTALPLHSVDQREAAQIAKRYCCHSESQEQLLSVIYRRSDVRTRGSVLIEGHREDGLQQSFFAPARDRSDLGPTTGERMERYSHDAPLLSLRAARAALQQAGTRADEITHLVTVSCTGFAAPGVDVELMRSLELPRTVERTNVGFMGCHGALNGLRVAGAFTRADPDARILLCAVELCTLHFRYGWDAEKVVANALFADGAAAMVASGASAARSGSWRVAASGSCLLPDSQDAMTWRVGDHGFEMTLSRRVPDLIGEHLRPWLAGWLGSQGLCIEQVGSWAVHPGGPRILSSVSDCLGLDEDATAVSRDVLAECGNMSSPTILFILDRLRRNAAALPCVALGFGPGLVAEVALLR